MKNTDKDSNLGMTGPIPDLALEPDKDKKCYWCDLTLDQHTKESLYCPDDKQVHVLYVGLTTFTPK